MDIIVEKGAGLDVHQETVVATIAGPGITKETKTYGTVTNELIRLRDWLKTNGITHVGMESTGIYWKPVFNILEEDFEVILVNARHIKHVPGRKTDVSDSEWLCRLLRNGLVKGSFIPPQDIRELRDLTRYRRKLMQSRAAEKNRIQKVLEDANIKLSSVVSDTFGASGMAIIDAILEGKLKVKKMADLARGKLRNKKKELAEALVGKITQHHVFMIRTSLDHIKSIDGFVADVDRQTDEKLKPYAKEVELLETIPGVKEQGSASIIAEIGTDMEQFASAEHISSWAGMSPGNNQSGGKRKTAKSPHGNKALKTTLTELAWAASRKKNCYLRSKFHSLVGRRGAKRALIAVGHKILIICYQILKKKVPYQELGADFLDRRKKDKVAKSYINRLNALGYEVTINKTA